MKSHTGPLCFNFFLFYVIQLDPFLHLVEDHKLKAVNPDQLQTVAYGCQEDDASALDTLSKIAVSTVHSRETLVYKIVKSLENMGNSEMERKCYFQSEMEKMREQFLTELMPDDACPLGTHVLEDSRTSLQPHFGDVKPQHLAALSSHGDQEFGDVSETVTDDNPVVVTTRQMGLVSFRTAADASYKEMTLRCENPFVNGKTAEVLESFEFSVTT